MITLNTRVLVEERINASSCWYVIEIMVLSIVGLEWRGKVTLLNKSPDDGGERQIFDWTAKYMITQVWLISGPGAKIGNSCVPDTNRYPFSMDDSINTGLRRILPEWIQKNRSGTPALAPAPQKETVVVGRVAVTVNGNRNHHNEVEVAVVSPTSRRIVTPAPPSVIPAARVDTLAVPGVIVLEPPPVPKPAPVQHLEPSVALEAGTAIVVQVNECVVFQPAVNDPRFTGQPRKHFDEKKLMRLGKSLQNGQRQHIKVIALEGFPGKKWEIIDGERRWRAAQLVGIMALKAVVEVVKSKKEQHFASLVLNFNKEEHTPLELSNALQEQVEAGETIANLADAIGKSRMTVSGLLSLQKMHPDLKPLLDPPTPKKDRIPIMHGRILSRIALEKQVEVWNEAKKQPTKSLALAKINELGKSNLVATPRRNNWSRNDQVTLRVERKVNRIDMTLMELDMLSFDDLVIYVRLLKSEKTAASVVHLTELEKKLHGFQEKLSRAMELVNAPAVPA